MNLQLIKSAVSKKPYSYYFISIFLAYMLLNIILSEFYITLKFIPYYLNTIKWHLLFGSALLSLTIGIMIAINFNLIIMRYKETKRLNVKLTPLGFILGLSTGICPACISGIFPLLFSAIGISLLALPLKGLEIQFLSLVLLLLSAYFLSKDTKICKINV